MRLSDTILVMAPAPGRIVRRFDITMPTQRGDDAWVYRRTAEMLQTRAVRESFALPPLPSSPDSRAPADDLSGIREVAARATQSAKMRDPVVRAGCGG